MALSISQIVSASYPAVLAETRKPSNQWSESAFLRELERQGAIERSSLGPTIERPLDYRKNPGTDFLATDMTETSLAKTDVISSASYDVAQLSVPIVWSKGDDAMNTSENQKVALVKSLITNAIDSHDDAIELALFSTTTDGFLGMSTIIPTSGQGTVGGIDASTETMWRNQTGAYVDDSDIEAGMTTIFNNCAKGSAAKLSPKIIVSGATAQTTFESTQQAFQRYVDDQDLKAGFKTIAFKTARYVYSQYGGTKLYFINPTSFRVVTSKQYFRDKGETVELPNANAFVSKVYSALQTVTDNKSRLGVLYITP